MPKVVTSCADIGFIYKFQLNKIAARWPARAVAQFLRSSK